MGGTRVSTGGMGTSSTCPHANASQITGTSSGLSEVAAVAVEAKVGGSLASTGDMGTSSTICNSRRHFTERINTDIGGGSSRGQGERNPDDNRCHENIFNLITG